MFWQLQTPVLKTSEELYKKKVEVEVHYKWDEIDLLPYLLGLLFMLK